MLHNPHNHNCSSTFSIGGSSWYHPDSLDTAVTHSSASPANPADLDTAVIFSSAGHTHSSSKANLAGTANPAARPGLGDLPRCASISIPYASSSSLIFVVGLSSAVYPVITARLD